MSSAQLLWLDMEMTGLDVEKEVPIEVAAIATDWEMNSLGDYHTVIKQPQKYLDAMDQWNRNQHGISGLTALIPDGKDPLLADEELAAFVKQHFGRDKAILAGNSIAQDKLFITRYMPKTNSLLHYRTMDVTAWKVIFNGVFKQKFVKKDGHRAVDDIRESINELKFYMSFVDPKAKK